LNLKALQDCDLDSLKAKWKKEQEDKYRGLTPKQIKHLKAVEYCKSMNEDFGNLQYGDCNKCFNRGYIHYLDKDDNICAKDCDCLKARKSRQLIEFSGLKNVIDSKTFESYNAIENWQQVLKNNAIKYTKSQKEWFLIAGQSGIGKSHLCTAIVGELIKQNKQVIYISYIKHIPELKKLTFEKDKYNELLNSWLKCEVLYIDDLFKITSNDSDKTTMLKIIDYRNINDSKTIISTERSTNDLIAIDEATFGRIREKCGEYVYEIGKDSNKNYRLKEQLC